MARKICWALRQVKGRLRGLVPAMFASTINGCAEGIPTTKTKGKLAWPKTSFRSMVRGRFGLTRSSVQGHEHGPDGDLAGNFSFPWSCFGQQEFFGVPFFGRLPNPSARQQHKPGPTAVANIRYKSSPARIMKLPMTKYHARYGLFWRFLAKVKRPAQERYL